MKITFVDNKIVIYISKDYMNLDYDNIEEYFKDIFIKLKDYYNINLKGFFNANIYIDSLYGAILELEKEELDFIEYYDFEIDMKTKIIKTIFLYKKQDNYKLDNVVQYFYNNSIYIKPNALSIDILEHCEVCYRETEKIIKYGKLIEV